MKAFKLMRIRKDGTLGPLFINRPQRIPIGDWLNAESHPTKGYKYRPGWHCCSAPWAPHLKLKKDRVWCEVDIEDFVEHKRPDSQGGLWYVAKRMMVTSILGEGFHGEI